MSESLTSQLQSADLLLIDGLHASDFILTDANGLHIQAMDGRALKRWQFSTEQLAAAQFDSGAWQLASEQSAHQLVCLSAFTPSEEDDEDETPTP